MFGECGTSRNKNVHHYYKCANAKRTKTCKKKTVRKEWLEDLVVNETMKMIRDDDSIQSIVDAVMILQEQENTVLPLLEKQMKDIENGIENLLNAIQAGVLTSSTKGRLEKLEAQQKELEIRIAEEKLAKPKVSADFVKFWLTNFRKLANEPENPVGRSLDFMVQEIFRECNTLGNKAGSTEISPRVVMLKTELEKIREQVQNIE